MKISPRELKLAWITMAAALIGGTVWLGEPRLKEWKEFDGARAQLEARRVEAEAWLERKTNVETRLEALRKELPKYPPGQDVTSELLRMLERTSQEHGLNLSSRNPDKEKSLGDLFEVAITCAWEGDLDALVHFLYALQVKGAILDIRQLTVQPGQAGRNRLRGTFVLDCAYSREALEAEAGSLVVEPAQP